MATERPSPITSSPLKIRAHKRGALRAEDPEGHLVLDGMRGTTRGSDPAVLETAGGTWRVVRGADGATSVLDRDATPVARIKHRLGRETHLILGDGEVIPVARRRSGFAHGCRIGDLAEAQAPALFPQRFVELALTEALLARDDRFEPG